MQDNPASQLVGRLAITVVAAAAAVVCAASELANIKNLQASVSSAQALITEELENVQSDLEGKSILYRMYRVTWKVGAYHKVIS